jgi:hypothetical protein
MFMVLLGVVAAQLDGSLSPRMLETLQGRCAAELAAPSSPRALYAAMQYSDETVACANLGLIHTATSYSDVVYAHLACMRAKCDCGETIGTAAMRLIDAGVKGLGEDVGAAKAYLSAVAAGVAPADERVLEAASAMYTQGDDNVVSDPELFQLLNGAGVKTNIKPKHLSLSFQVFLSAASGADVAQAAAAVGALTALETTKFFPVHTRLTTNTFAAGSKISLTFATTTALDQPVADANVQVKSVSNSAGENVPFSDGAVMAAGLYSVATSLSLAERSKPISSTLSFVVQAQASVTGVRALISPDHAIDTSDMPKGSFMEGDNEGHAERDHVVHVAFSVSGAADVLQTVVRFTHSETGKSVYVPTKSASGAGTYKATVALADKAKMFDHSSGTYHVVILVGDAALAAPVLTSLGDVQLAFTPPVKIIEPLYAKSLLDESDRYYPLLSLIIPSPLALRTSHDSVVFPALTSTISFSTLLHFVLGP